MAEQQNAKKEEPGSGGMTKTFVLLMAVIILAFLAAVLKGIGAY